MKLHNSKRARFAKRPKNGVTSSTKKNSQDKEKQLRSLQPRRPQATAHVLHV